MLLSPYVALARLCLAQAVRQAHGSPALPRGRALPPPLERSGRSAPARLNRFDGDVAALSRRASHTRRAMLASGSMNEPPDLGLPSRIVLDERNPGPGTRRWLSYAPPPADAERLDVRECVDDPSTAVAFGERVRRLVSAGRPVALDFRDMGIATQSFLHALLFQAVRVGWAMGAPIHVLHASSAVRSGLDYLESYALK